MERLIKIIEVIGAKKFRKICFRRSLNSKEINAFREVLRGYENMDKTVFCQDDREKDLKERKAAKEAVFAHAVKRLDIFSQKKICSPLAEILNLELDIINQARIGK